MSYQSRQIHVVEMTFSNTVSIAEFQQWLTEVETFLLRQQAFVLVMQTHTETTFPEEYRKLQAVWYKKHKSAFFKYCIGLARIALDDADLQRLNTPALHAAWRVPYHVTLDHADALHWAVQRWSCKT